MNVVEGLVSAAENLRDHSTSVAQQLLMSKGPVAWIYNPLEYAWEPHKAYLERFGGLGAKTLLVGMNPGHGMGNTGVPFGCPEKVRDVLKITNLEVKEPAKTHPRRKVYGLSCPKVEISGRRIWGFLSTHFGNAKEIHRHLLVANHCPLWMFDKDGRNITPDKLRGDVAKELTSICDQHLNDVAQVLNISRVIGVGRYAEKCARKLFDGGKIIVDHIPHPSPANPASNRNGGADWRASFANVLGF